MQKEGFDVSCIKIDKILIGIEKLRKIMPQNAHIKKEQSFIMYIPHNEIIDSKIEDEILIQGVVDLMFVTDDEIILVDFKNTRIQNPNILREKYVKQLELYSLAIKLNYEVHKVKAFIYSIQSTDLIMIN